MLRRTIVCVRSYHAVGHTHTYIRANFKASKRPEEFRNGTLARVRPMELIYSSPVKSPVKSQPSAYFRVVWQSPAACKLLKVHLIGAMAWKRSSVRSRPGPPNKPFIFKSLLQFVQSFLLGNCAPKAESAYRESNSSASFISHTFACV